MQQHAGTDCTAEFEEVFHSPAARKQLADYVVGSLKGYTGDPDAALKSSKAGATAGSSPSTANASSGNSTMMMAVAAIIAVGAAAYFLL